MKSRELPKASLTMTSDSAEIAMLLFQVRSAISASGCADRIDAERWSTAWLDTPDVALRRRAPAMPDKTDVRHARQ